MEPSELDELLDAMAAPLPPDVQHAARRLGRATRPDDHRRRSRHRWLVPGLAIGAVVLTAGAATATVVMSHWAGVSMPLENVRNTAPLPISWTTETGHEEQCRVWIELRHPQPTDADALDTAIESRDWNGLGQQLYSSASPVPDDPDGESRVSDALAPVIQDFVAEVFPGITWFGDSHASTARAVDAWGMTCAPEAD